MKNRYVVVLAATLGLASLPALACTPEEALAKAEETAETIHRLAGGDPQKANRMYEELLKLQAREPTTDRFTACEAYDRVIKELEAKANDSQSN